LGFIIIVQSYILTPFISSLIILCISSFLWGKDIHREACYEGGHNKEILEGFKLGIIFFIFSECFFFLGMFWSYLHLAESPAIELGISWPPQGVSCFDPIGIPFLNTTLLVSSGISVTWCHHAIELGWYKTSLLSLLVTVLIGSVFTVFQLIEYYVAGFTFSCSSFSSSYFLGTGFHGIHVLIGRVLLSLSLIRFFKLFISPNHRAGFECSVWYWHFVDVVWFFLYLIFYWWGS